jgi:ribosomal protein S18 acetylase RimI-like enzyme
LPAWTIRSATHDDIQSVLGLWSAAESLPTVSDSSEGLGGLLRADSKALLLAQLDGVLGGSLIAAWDGWRGSFYRLVVVPEHRRKGIATALLRAGEQRLRELGALRFTAIVVGEDAGASAFWQRAGYERQRDRVRYVRHP